MQNPARDGIRCWCAPVVLSFASSLVVGAPGEGLPLPWLCPQQLCCGLARVCGPVSTCLWFRALGFPPDVFGSSPRIIIPKKIEHSSRILGPQEESLGARPLQPPHP